MSNKICILNTAYFPPIEFFIQILTYKEILIEGHESYSKQTYRNRCNILSPNGKLSLVVPVTKGNSLKMHTNKISILHSDNWQRNHQRALETAYNNSPYFLYYKDEIFDLLDRASDNLFEFNLKTIKAIAEIININASHIKTTEEYIKEYQENTIDLRDKIHPKKVNLLSPSKECKYFQVFVDKYGFTYNLSILDLVFNEGPQSLDFLTKLKESIKIR